MTAAHIRAAIEQVAPAHGLDPDLVEAVVLTESGGDPCAIRYEPAYPWLVNARTRQPFRTLSREERVSAAPPADFPALPGVSPATEWMQQRTSWGVMQVMGAVAREYGCRDPFLSRLCEPLAGLGVGCRLLAGHLAWAKQDVPMALRAYNGGRGGVHLPVTSAYAAKVTSFLAQIRGGVRRA